MSVTIWAALWGPQGDFPCVTLLGPEVLVQVLVTPPASRPKTQTLKLEAFSTLSRWSKAWLSLGKEVSETLRAEI